MLNSLPLIKKRTTTNPLFSKSFFIVLFSLFGVFTQAQTINAPTFSPEGPYCEGASLTVAFTTSGTFTSGNIFTAQLSEPAGTFGTGVVDIGSLTLAGNSPSGSISAVIPANTVAGTTYRIRVVSSAPAVNGAANATDITIAALPAAFNVTGGGSYCEGATATAPEVGLSGSQVGVNYTLYRLAEDNTLRTVRTDPGTGAAINFGQKTLAGTYTVVATSATGGCTSNMSGSATVTVNPLPTVEPITGTTTICSGRSTALASATAGGTWSSSNTNVAVVNRTTGLVVGRSAGSATISYTVTNENNCTNTTTTTVTVLANPQAEIVSKHGGCNTNQQANGDITFNGTGGTGPYTYTWNGGTSGTQEGNVFTNIQQGSYNFTISDANGCASTKAVQFFPLYAEVYAQRPQLCNQGDSTFLIVKARETIPATAYQYSFFNADDPTTPTVPYSAGKYLLSVKAGSYIARVRDNTGCEYTSGTITVTNPVSSLTLNATSERLNCTATGGQITAMGEGGTGALVYAVDNLTFTPQATFTGLTAGNHRVRVADATGYCYTTRIVTVSPALTSATVKVGKSLVCAGRTTYLAVYPRGGTAPYTYQISTQGSASQTNNTFTVKAGTYSVTVTDAGGCTVQTSPVTITESTPILLPTRTITNVSCNGGADGAFTVTASGGTPPYQYRLGYTNSFQTSGTFTGLTAANYRLFVRDATGCTALFIIPVTQPATPCAQGKGLYVNNKGAGDINELSIRVGPNPSKSDFTLNIQSSKKENLQIKVSDMHGRPVHRITGSSNQTYRFGSRFAAGVYVVEVLQGTKTRAVKVIKSE